MQINRSHVLRRDLRPERISKSFHALKSIGKASVDIKTSHTHRAILSCNSPLPVCVRGINRITDLISCSLRDIQYDLAERIPVDKDIHICCQHVFFVRVQEFPDLLSAEFSRSRDPVQITV